MPDFEAGDIIRVPLAQGGAEGRPALVISGQPMGPASDRIWAMMITSAANRGWPGDIPLEEDHETCGLPVPSLIRTEKMALIDTGSAVLLGRLDKARLDAVREMIESHLGYRPRPDLLSPSPQSRNSIF